MDNEKFREIESKYRELKILADNGSITSDDLKVKLKKMMIKDEDGNYWMIGSNTGKWYIYNGTDWKEKSPYLQTDLSKTQNFNNNSNETIIVQNDSTLIKQDTSLDNYSLGERTEEPEKSHNIDISEEEKEASSVTEEDSDTLCIICKSKLDPHSIYCSFCGANQKELSTKKTKSGEELLIQSVRITSIVFFFGGLGLIIGVIFGATFGIFDIFGDLLNKFPEMLAQTRGKIQGGLIFAAIGGISGFFSFALAFGVAGVIYNAFSFLFGGIRIRTR